MEKIYDMIVIGGGPAGYTAALYAARSGLSVLVLEKLSAGGQMALTEQIDNYPGFESGIDGFTLGEKMQQSAERFGAVTELAEVYKASLSGKIKTLDTSEGVFQGRTVVIATGASHRPLGVPGEEALVGKGVHYCAACDGAPYRGRTVAVVGGGNSAAADALTLSRIAKKVYLIHRRDSLRATKVYHEPLMNAPNVEFCWNSTVSALLHDNRLTGLRLKDVNTGAERDLACDGAIFILRKRPAVLSPIPFTSFMDEFNLILLFYGNHIIVNWLSTVMYFHFYIWIFLFHFFCNLVGRILVHFLAIVNT